ncbi:retrotransposable element protein, partial [Planoprotostelium fungivorum]
PPPVVIDGEQEYEVEVILDVQKRYGKTQYLVSWKGYGPEENLWLPEDNLSNSPDLVADFKARTARGLFEAPLQVERSRTSPSSPPSASILYPNVKCSASWQEWFSKQAGGVQQFPPSLYRACSDHTKAYKSSSKYLPTHMPLLASASVRQRLLSFRMQCFPPSLYKACFGHTKAYKCFAENLQTDDRKQAFSMTGLSSPYLPVVNAKPTAHHFA